MTPGCNLFKVFSLIVLISDFFFNFFFFFLSLAMKYPSNYTSNHLILTLSQLLTTIHNPNSLLMPEPLTKRYGKLQRLQGQLFGLRTLWVIWRLWMDQKIRPSTWDWSLYISPGSSGISGSPGSGGQKPVLGGSCLHSGIKAFTHIFKTWPERANC